MLLFIVLIIMLAVMVNLLMIPLSTFLARGIFSRPGCLGFVLRLARTIGPAEEIAHDGLHPLRKRGEALAQVIADGDAVIWILQHRDEARADVIHVAGQQVAHPIERLNDTHRGVPGPVQVAGRRMLKMNGQVAEVDRFSV
jgi:hypothetical protein